MAWIGVEHAVAAEFDAHTAGSKPTYKSSSGFDVGGLIAVNLTKTRNTNKLYYDNRLGESDKGLTGMNIEMNVDDLLESVLENMGLMSSTSTGSPSVTTYYEGTGDTKQLGVGYMRTREKDGTVSYQGVWFYKVKFALDSENTNTKGENVEYQTPTVNGEAFPLDVDSSGEDMFREVQVFTTESACKAWLDAKAGITRT